MIEQLKTRPFYIFLLPVFFVIHGFVENAGFLSVKDASLLCLYYLLVSLILWGLGYLIFKKWNASAIFAFFLMCFYFFFGAVHTLLKNSNSFSFVSRYSILLSLFLLLFILLFFYLKRSSSRFYRLTLFLNILLMVYILVDIGSGITKKPGGVSQGEQGFSICDTCKKPNIYFLLFDEYQSSVALKKFYNFDNDLDTFLISKGFQVQANSRSNYNFTPFSMASILNMQYVPVANREAVNVADYSNSNRLIKNNEVCRLLKKFGYEIRNYSIFDLEGHPAMVNQSLLPLNTRLITGKTFFAYSQKDIGWIFINNWPINLLFRNHFLEHKKNNEKFIGLVKQAAAEKTSTPKFIYAHLDMPHAPFFFDEHGNARDNKTVYKEFVGEAPLGPYLGYVRYTNTRIRELVNSILKNDPSSVIIILGDHGFRVNKYEAAPEQLFQNMNAVYFDDRQYGQLYDSMTTVNEFRCVFNKLFRQQMPLLRDSMILLKDKK